MNPSLSQSMTTLPRFLSLIRPGQRKYMAALAGRVLIATIERMTIAYLAKNVVDTITAGNEAAMWRSVAGWVAFYVGYALIAPFVMYAWHAALVTTTATIRGRVFRHLQRLPLGYQETHHSGDALSILTNDVTAAERAYQQDLLALVEASMMGVSAVVFMLLLNAPLALAFIVGTLPPLVINVLFAGPLRKVGTQVQERLGVLSERMSDLLAGYQVIRTFSLGDWILARFAQANGDVYESSLQRVRAEAALAGGNEFAGLFFMLPITFGGYLVMTGRTTFGVLLGLVQLSGQVMYFVYSISGTISRVQAALAAADRILAVLDVPVEAERYHAVLPAAPEVAPDGQAQPCADGAAVSFRQVTFGYQADQPILEDLSFTAQPGQMIGFAGPSGGGKSTIFKLLLGGYRGSQGQICVSGQALEHYCLSELREQFAYVPQDAYLFSGSIAENIRYGKPSAAQEEIEAAAQAAFAHDFIRDLPLGYQTLVGERGARLSGGQRQRIAIARALLKNAPILLLDEATSALDSESESVVQQALAVLMQGRTSLVIAHRFSTILNADRIYVIERGRVVEQGSHAVLLAQAGLYTRLFQLQFQG